MGGAARGSRATSGAGDGAEIAALQQEVQKGRVEKSAELTALQQEVRRRESSDAQQEERWREQHRVLNASFMGKPILEETTPIATLTLRKCYVSQRCVSPRCLRNMNLSKT